MAAPMDSATAVTRVGMVAAMEVVDAEVAATDRRYLPAKRRSRYAERVSADSSRCVIPAQAGIQACCAAPGFAPASPFEGKLISRRW
jgi:hypothetical protein